MKRPTEAEVKEKLRGFRGTGFFLCTRGAEKRLYRQYSGSPFTEFGEPEITLFLEREYVLKSAMINRDNEGGILFGDFVLKRKAMKAAVRLNRGLDFREEEPRSLFELHVSDFIMSKYEITRQIGFLIKSMGIEFALYPIIGGGGGISIFCENVDPANQRKITFSPDEKIDFEWWARALASRCK